MRRRPAARWLLAALIVIALAAAAVPYLTRVAEVWVRKEIEARGSKAIGGEVTVARVEIGLFPPTLRLRDLRLKKRGNRGSAATAGVDRVVVRASWPTFLGLRAGPVAIVVERPALDLTLAEGRPLVSDEAEGPILAGALPAAEPGSSLEIKGGTIDVRRADGARLRLEDTRAAIRPGTRPGSLSGRVEFAAGRLEGLAGDWPGLAGDGAFEISADGIRLDPVSVRGQGIALAGRLTFGRGAEQAVTGDLRVNADVARLAAFLPANAAGVGRVEARLEGSWDAGGPHARGDLAGVGIALYGVRMDSLRSDIEIAPGAGRATAIKAHLLGGEATGSCDLSWGSAPWTARTDLSIDGVDLSQILQLASWSGPAMRGTVHYRGRHALDGSGVLSLRGSGVLDAVGHYPSPRGIDLPLELTAQLETEGETVHLSGGTIRAGSVRGNFSGSASPGEGIRLRLSGATGDISEIAPLFATPRPRVPKDERAKPPPRTAPPARGPGGRAARVVRLVSWAPDPSDSGGLERVVKALGGRWSWDGDLQYDRGALRFDGRLAGDDLTFHGTALGSLEARVRYHDDTLSMREATLRPVEGGEVRMQGSVAFKGEGSVAIDAEAADCPIGPILRAAGKDLPIDGTISARLKIGGRPLAPAGRATIDYGRIQVAGVRFDGLRGTVLFTPDRLELDRVVLTQGLGILRLDGRMPYGSQADGGAGESGAGGRQVAIEGTDLDLSLWAPVGAAVLPAGTAALSGSIGGSLDAPSGHLELKSEDLLLSGRELGPVTLVMDLIQGSVALKGEAPQQHLSVEGRLGLGAGFPADLRAVFTGAEVRGPMVLGALEEAKIVATGRAEVQGPLADRKALRARATLDHLEGSVAGVTVAARGTVEATLADGRLRMAPIVLEGGGTQVEIGGAVDVADQGGIDLTARGSFDLRLLRTLLKNLQATGSGEVELRVSGRREDPSFSGHLKVRADAIRYPDLPFPIGDLEALGSFQESGMQIETLRFRAGGGQVEGQGDVALGPGEASGSLFAVRRADLRLGGTDVKCEFPEGFRSASDLDLTFHLDAEGATLGGTINLVRAVYGRDFRIESSIVGGKGPDFFALRSPGGPIAGVGLDLTIRAAGDVWLRNDFGTIEGQGELHVRGSAARPSVAGRITASEGGTIRFRNVKYRVDQGTLDFADPEAINPIFDLQAETTVAEYQVALKVQGTADNFKYELSSTPPLPQSDIVVLLVTGHTPGTFATGSRAIGEETVTAYLSGRLSEELSQKIGGRAGLDRIAIDPLQLNGQGDPTARVTLGKQVTPDLFVTYSSDLGSTQGAMYQLDYSLRRDLRLTTLRDQDGSLGGDLRYLLRGKPPSLPVSGVADAVTPERPLIASIHLEGERRVRDAQVLRKLRLRAGRRRDRGAVNDGVDRLLKFYHNRGYLMAEVDAREAPAGPDKVDLTVRIRAGPRIKIEFEGTRTREGYRQNIEPYWERGIFLDDIVEEARSRIVSLFHDRGYQRADVTAQIGRHDDEVFQVLFTIKRGPRVKATEVRVAGASRIPEARLLKVIDSHPEGLFARGLVRDGQLRHDASAIRSLYLARGFPQVDVPFPEVILDDRGRRAAVVFHVQEGPHVTLRDVRFENTSGLTAERLRKAAALKPGGPYTAEEADAAAIRLKRAYDEAGYPDARIHARLDSEATDEGEEWADLVFGVEEGLRQRVGRVSIDGNVLTHERVIRKALTLKPGDPLSRTSLLESQRRLYQRGIFTSAAVDPGPLPASAGAGSTPGAAQADPAPRPPAAPRPIYVTVREAAPLSQVFGLGYDSEEKTRVQYGIAHRNVFGSGRYLGLDTRASDLQQIASLLYREMGVFGGPYDALASAFWEDQVRPGFSARTIGSSVQISRQVTRATRTLYSYSLRDVDESKAPALVQSNTLRLSGLTASTVHDTRDALFDPARGHYVSGELQIFDRSIGSEADFAKLYAQAFVFREVLPKTVWAQALRAGAAYTFGDTRRDPSATGDAVSGLPPSERFFGGGDTTLRGFKRDRVGPLDAGGDPLGGEGLFLVNEELRFPIFHDLQGVVFYDAGNVYRRLSEYDLSDLRHVAGAGLRVATPIGPFRFEYGALLNRRAGEPAGQFFISIGQAF